MNGTAQPTGPYPATLQDWERVLTAGLLRSVAGDADPIRSFEITPETLAQHCGLGPAHADDAERAFRRVLRSDIHLAWCLQHGTLRTPGDDTPNCMAPLALSLLVDSLIDGDYDGTGAYRAKLAQWLDIDRSFTDLRGIATMWKELVAWLDRRVEAGAPFRRLILPQIPATWTHIGYTRYLSFPTRRDLRFLSRQLERNASAAAEPAGLVRLLDPVIRSSPVSFGLRAAFDDFRAALRTGRASVDHRFWRLIGRARVVAGQQVPAPAELRMEFDEDCDRTFRLRSSDIGPVSLPPDIGNAAANRVICESPNLGPGARRGVLFFWSSGLASWTATGEPPSGGGQFHVAFAERHHRLASGAIVRLEQSGTWWVTVEPVNAGTVADFLRRLGIRTAAENVRTLGLVDGVHVGRSWLGQPRFLPKVEGATGAVAVASAKGAPAPACVDGRLSSAVVVEGDFTIGDPVAGWSRRVSFSPLACVHPALDGANYALPLLEEWLPGRGRGRAAASSVDAAWDETDYAFQDVVEAVYAASRSGIGEGDLVALIDRALGRRSWDFLRTLQESTVLDARLRQRWRGRVFTLVGPSLALDAVRDGVVVSGAIPSRLEEDFRRTVELNGGRPFRRLRSSSLAPPLLGAVAVDPVALAAALGWPSTPADTPPDGTPQDRLRESHVVGEGYAVASAWDWALGRFRVGTDADGPVSLVRMVHPGGRDHDLYRVDGHRRRTFTSRHAAILDAHSQAGRPLFRYVDESIVRIVAEGALPVEVARAHRLRTLVNGGACASGWTYAASADDAQWLAGLMPGIVEGVSADGNTDGQSLHRRGRGARRPLWIDGAIAA